MLFSLKNTVVTVFSCIIQNPIVSVWYYHMPFFSNVETQVSWLWHETSLLAPDTQITPALTALTALAAEFKALTDLESFRIYNYNNCTKSSKRSNFLLKNIFSPKPKEFTPLLDFS